MIDLVAAELPDAVVQVEVQVRQTGVVLQVGQCLGLAVAPDIVGRGAQHPVERPDRSRHQCGIGYRRDADREIVSLFDELVGPE